MRLSAGNMSFNLAVTRNHDLALGKQVHGDLHFNLVADFCFLGVERLGQLCRDEDAGKNFG